MNAVPIGTWPKPVEQKVAHAHRLAVAGFPHSAAILLREAAAVLDGVHFPNEHRLCRAMEEGES